MRRGRGQEYRRKAEEGIVPLGFDVRHVTRYLYDAPVFLEPHIIRLKPSTDPGQRLIRFEVEIQPEPAGTTEILDLEGNSVFVAWFENKLSELLIRTFAEVEVRRSNPFDYFLFNDASLPYRYPAGLAEAATSYMAAPSDLDVIHLGERVARQVGGSPGSFLSALAAEVRHLCRVIVRPEGEPRPAGETLRRGEGSCRDLAIVFIDACRSMGFAARFVSGYHTVLDEEDHDLHAWGEAYLDGGGWRGFDPTTGLAVGENHIAVARASRPTNAAPVTGSFRGSAGATLESGVTIKVGE